AISAPTAASIDSGSENVNEELDINAFDLRAFIKFVSLYFHAKPHRTQSPDGIAFPRGVTLLLKSWP
ncbi:MAG TPA: hypothetical protein DDW24_12400, partial [Blastocatellia bacterium]|nr:hypothetical protein [Blastocatellia bacterium]